MVKMRQTYSFESVLYTAKSPALYVVSSTEHDLDDKAKDHIETNKLLVCEITCKICIGNSTRSFHN